LAGKFRGIREGEQRNGRPEIRQKPVLFAGCSCGEPGKAQKNADRENQKRSFLLADKGSGSIPLYFAGGKAAAKNHKGHSIVRDYGYCQVDGAGKGIE
jgi:hypothetical protein